MRFSQVLIPGCLLLVVVGCAGPQATGELWAQRLVEQETEVFRLSDAQRADRLRSFQFGLVDETLASERARIDSGLSDCPGPNAERQPLAVSVGDRSRDMVRIQANGDRGRITNLAHIALGDWYLRRARASGDPQFCDAARAALSGQSPAATSDLLTAPGTATVSRDPGHPGTVAEAGTVNASMALSNYALGYVDTVQAYAPLPQYLAAVYGGVVVGPTAAPGLNGAAPESLVDRFAPAYPDWEPDALYALLVAQ